MKPYNCNCIYISQVSELKAQKEELLSVLKWLNKHELIVNSSIALNRVNELIQKYKPNE